MLPFAANEQVLYSAAPEARGELSVGGERRNQSRRGPDVDASRPSLEKTKRKKERKSFLKKQREQNSFLLSSVFFFYVLPLDPPPPPREHKVRIFTYLSICHYADFAGAPLRECPWTAVLNNYEDYVQCRETNTQKFAIQNKPRLRQERLATGADR